MGIDAIFNAHNWALVPFHFWSLCFFVARLHHRQLPERVHPPDAAGHEHHLAAVALPALQVFHSVVSEHSAGDLAGVAWTLQKLRRAHLAALLHRGTAHRALRFWAAGWRLATAGHPLQSMPLALVYAVFLAGLIVATFIDFEHLIIPDEITLGGMVVGFIASFFLPALHGASTLTHGAVAGFYRRHRGRGDSLRGIAAGQMAVRPAARKTAGGGENCFQRNGGAPARQNHSLRRPVLPAIGRDRAARENESNWWTAVI